MEQVFFGNTVKDYLIAAGIMIVGLFVIRIFRQFLLSWLKRKVALSVSTFDDFLIQGIATTLMPLLYYGGGYYALNTLTLPAWLNRALDVAGMFLWTFLITRLIIFTVHYFLQTYLKKRGRESAITQLRGITLIVSIVIWSIAILFFINNLGYNVTTILTGLGIGGIAIALATQTILADLFNYFVLFFDRPFEVGDFIVVEDKSGTVEAIGIKTTRVRALSGEQLVFSNTDLTNSRLHNFKRMQQRRVVFTLGVTYTTPKEKLEKIPQVIQDAITQQADTRFDRAHFVSLGDFSLIFEAVYYVLTDDYNRYMDIQQAINLHLYEVFQREHIEFAFPTQSMIVQKSPDNDGLDDVLAD